MTEFKTKEICFTWNGVSFNESIKGLVLSNMTMVEIKESLNNVSGKHAYWSSLYADIAKQISNKKLHYDLWYAGEYSKVANIAKMTEPVKKNKVTVDNLEKIKNDMLCLNELICIKGKIKAIVDGYEMQSKMLQTISGITRDEIKILGG